MNGGVCAVRIVCLVPVNVGADSNSVCFRGIRELEPPRARGEDFLMSPVVAGGPPPSFSRTAPSSGASSSSSSNRRAVLPGCPATAVAGSGGRCISICI